MNVARKAVSNDEAALFGCQTEWSNYFLNAIVKTAKRGEVLEGRLVSFLLAVSFKCYFIYIKFLLCILFVI